MRDKLRGLIGSNFYVPEGEPLGDDESLLGRGIIDSTSILELIAFLTEEFHVEVADDEIVPENLDSIARIEAFVRRKQAGAN